MNEKKSDDIIRLYLQEYSKLKEEQVHRIGFRDNLLYVNLLLCSGILSFGLAAPTNYYALLLIPWVCFILGWSYIMNDVKITEIGAYIKGDFINHVQEYANLEGFSIFGWETTYRAEKHRTIRKLIQIISKLAAFVLAGAAALVGFWHLHPNTGSLVLVLIMIEAGLLLLLTAEILRNADIGILRKLLKHA